MIINTRQMICNLEGVPLKIQGSPDKDGTVGLRDLTLRDVISEVMMGALPNENPAPADKLRYYELALRFFSAPDDECDLSIEDAALVLERSGLLSNTLVHGRLTSVLNGIAKGDENMPRLPADIGAGARGEE